MKLALAISALMAVPSALATISIQFYTTTDCSGSVYTARQVFSDDNGACHNTMLPDYSVVKAYKAINSNSSTGTGAQYLRIWYDSQCQVDVGHQCSALPGEADLA